MTQCRVGIFRGRIATAGRKYEAGGWVKLPEGYYIPSIRDEGKRVAYLNDYRNVGSFSDKLDIVAAQDEGCSEADVKKIADALPGQLKPFNLGGKPAFKAFPDQGIISAFSTKGPSLLEQRLKALRDKFDIEEYECSRDEQNRVISCVVYVT